MYKFRQIKVIIDNVEQDAMKALILIDKVLKKNKWKLDIDVHYDYHSEELGYYVFNRAKQKYCIYVNPNKCYNFNDENDYCPQYTEDNSIFTVLIHEFIHLLTFTVLPHLEKDYKHAFPTERFYVNDYASKNISDEIAELGVLYINNPYFLKLIAPKQWKWFSEYFKSAQPCSPQFFMLVYDNWPATIKQKCASDWLVVIDQEKNKPVCLAKK